MTLSGMGGPGSPGSVPGLSLVTLAHPWPLIGWWALHRPPRPQMALITAYFDNSLSPIMSYWRRLYPNFPRSSVLSQPSVASAWQWMPALEIMSYNDPPSLLTLSWHLSMSLIWTCDPEVPLVHTDLAPSPRRCFSPDVWTLLLSPVWASVSSWSALGLWLASGLQARLWLAERLGSREACVSESHKLVFKALYLLIKPTSEEFVTRTPALFVSVPKWSTRARPNWDLLTKLFSCLAFVMFEAFWGRSG